MAPKASEVDNSVLSPTKGPRSKQTSTQEMCLLSVYVVGVWISFLVYAWVQEALAKEDFDGEIFKFTHMQVMLQSFANCIMAFIGIIFESWCWGLPFHLNAGVEIRHWFIASLGYQGAHFFGIQSLHYVSFPIQVVCKSCKTIPVLIGETLIAGQKASVKKWVSVCTLSMGVLIFLFFKTSKKKLEKLHHEDEFALNSDFLLGILMIFLALICDGIYGPYQNYIRREYKKCGPYHLMFNMNLWQGVFSLVLGVIDGELEEMMVFVDRHPKVVPYLINFCASMAIGSLFIFLLQGRYGALMVTKTTTVRKLISVLLSAYLFDHTITVLQWIGVFIVFSSKFTSGYIAGAIVRRTKLKSS